MVDRMRDALAGEMNRRQELLRSSGNFANVTEYEKARQAGADLDPLPALFIVVDEFSELLSQQPEFADLFVAIGRLGRSLHIHLLLASQRLEEGKLRGLDSHLSYRIGLKTFSANESRTVLGVPDATTCPRPRVPDTSNAIRRRSSASRPRTCPVPTRAAGKTVSDGRVRRLSSCGPRSSRLHRSRSTSSRSTTNHSRSTWPRSRRRSAPPWTSWSNGSRVADREPMRCGSGRSTPRRASTRCCRGRFSPNRFPR